MLCTVNNTGFGWSRMRWQEPLARCAVMTVILTFFLGAQLGVCYEYMGKPATDDVFEGHSMSFYKGELIVKFDSSISFDSATAIAGQFEVYPYVNHFVVGWMWCTFDTSRSVVTLCDSLATVAGVVRAKPNSLGLTASEPIDPYYAPDDDLEICSDVNPTTCDTTFVYQWYLHYHGPTSNFNQPVDPAAHIRIEPAWDVTRGDSSLSVLILDAGLALDDSGRVLHEDLDRERVRVGKSYHFNLDSLTGDNAYSHGTASTGLVAASFDNGLGIAGVLPKATVYVGQIGSSISVANGLLDACALGARVVNVSWLFPLSDADVIEPAVRILSDSGILIAASYGNESGINELPATFASWGTESGHEGGYPNVLNVGRIRQQAYVVAPQGTDTSKITLVAPGGPATQPMPTTGAASESNYIGHHNTSAASPLVAGAAALVLSHYSGLSASAVRSILEHSADRIWVDRDDSVGSISYRDSLYHPYYGFGRINVFRALNGWYGALDSSATIWDTTTLLGHDNRVYIADLTVPASCTLSVAAGIEVRAITTDIVDGTESGDTNSYPCELIVEGHLNVAGSPGSPVLFSSTNDTILPAWAGIHIKPGGSVSLQYVDIENAKVGLLIDSGGVVDTLVGCSFADCGTAIDLATDTLLLQDITISAPEDFALRCDHSSLIRLLGSAQVSGSSTNPARFTCRDDSTVGSWRGLEVLSGGTASFNFVEIGNAEAAILIDSGGILDTPLVHLTINDCGVGLDVESGLAVLRDVTMSGITDYGIYAAEGNPEIVLDSPVVISGTANSSVGVTIGTGARLTAAYTSVDTGYIGFEIQGGRVDQLSHCSITGQTFVGVYFRGSDSVDQSSYNVIRKDSAGALDFGMLVLDQSVESHGDSIQGGFSRDLEVVGDNFSGTFDSTSITGLPGDGYGAFLGGSYGGDSVFLDYPEVNGSFTTAHVYIYDIHAEIAHGTIATDTSSASVSPIGVYDRWNSTGRMRCTDILNQSVACVYRYDSSCSLQWGAASSSDTVAGYNQIYSPIDSAWLFKNDPGDSVDGRRNYWGSVPPDTTRIDVGVHWGVPLQQKQCGGAIIYEKQAASLEESESTRPLTFALEQNIPNPFNPATEIRFALPKDQAVTVTIYNVLGRVVRNLDLGTVSAGYRAVVWDGKTSSGREAGSGVYFYRLVTPEFEQVRKMLLLR